MPACVCHHLSLDRCYRRKAAGWGTSLSFTGDWAQPGGCLSGPLTWPQSRGGWGWHCGGCLPRRPGDPQLGLQPGPPPSPASCLPGLWGIGRGCGQVHVTFSVPSRKSQSPGPTGTPERAAQAPVTRRARASRGHAACVGAVWHAVALCHTTQRAASAGRRP